jgi:ketosteroid isomerase-like protein
VGDKLKADAKTQSEVIQSFKGMFEAYKKKDLQATLSFWASDPDIVVIGTGEDEKGTGLTYLTESLKRDWMQGEVQSIGVKNFSVSAEGSVAWLSADVTFDYKVAEGRFDLPTRLTAVMEKCNGKWLWVQMHLSTPSCGQEHGHSWPNPKE